MIGHTQSAVDIEMAKVKTVIGEEVHRIKKVVDNEGDRVNGITEDMNKYAATQVASFDQLKKDWADGCVAMRS